MRNFSAAVVVLARLCLAASLSAGLAPTVVLAADTPAPPTVGMVWSEHGLATAIAGGGTGMVQHKFYMALYGPMPQALGRQVSETVVSCGRRVTTALAAYFGSELDSIESSTSLSGDETDSQFADKIKERATRLGELTATTVDRSRTEVERQCPELPIVARDSLKPALTLRACDGERPEDECRMPDADVAWAGSRTANRFSLLVEWLDALTADDRALDLNTIVVLGFSSPAGAGKRKDRTSTAAIMRFVVDAEKWSQWNDGGGVRQRRGAFDEAIGWARYFYAAVDGEHRRMAAAVARTWGVAPSRVLAVADNLQGIPAIYDSLEGDDRYFGLGAHYHIGKARIRECAWYQRSPSTKETSRCVGYPFGVGGYFRGYSGVLRDDSGLPLDSEHGATGSAMALTIAGNYSAEELSVANLLPRALQDPANGETLTLGQLEAWANTCLQDTRRAGEKAAIFCVANKLGFDLFHKCRMATPALIADCVTGGNLSQSERQQLECLRVLESQPRCLMDLALARLDNVGPETYTEEMKQLKYCAEDMPDALLVCLKEDVVSEVIRRPFNCLEWTDGDPSATAICMVLDRVAPHQRVALQCAIATWPNPKSYVVCNAGWLLFSRIEACLADESLAEPCLSSNGPLRRQLALLLGFEVSDSTPLGSVMAARLDTARMTMAFSADVGDEVRRLSKSPRKPSGRLGPQRSLGPQREQLYVRIERALRTTRQEANGTRRNLMRSVSKGFIKSYVKDPDKVILNPLNRPERIIQRAFAT